MHKQTNTTYYLAGLLSLPLILSLAAIGWLVRKQTGPTVLELYITGGTGWMPVIIAGVIVGTVVIGGAVGFVKVWKLE